MLLREHEYRNEFYALKNLKCVDADDPLTDPRTAGYVETYLKPLRITSMLDAVIKLSGTSLASSASSMSISRITGSRMRYRSLPSWRIN